MKKRRILSSALAAIMAFSMSMPTYAATNYEGDLDDPGLDAGGKNSAGAIIEVQGGPGWNDGWNHGDNNYTTNGLNFYINLAGDVLDTTDSSGHHSTSLFTSALTSSYTVDGPELEKSVKNSSYYTFINKYYDGIVGTSNGYKATDSEIRSILANYITMPSDADILANVKTQIENGTKVHDINGSMISSSLVNTSYFNVYWYVLKEGSDYWHVDGILEKKDPPEINTYFVDYSWTTDAGPGLPSNMTPPATVEYAENDNVKIDTTYTQGQQVQVEGGYYEFSGWDTTEDFTITANKSITGTWTWHADEPLAEYTITIHYKHIVNGDTLIEDRTVTLTENDTYDMTSNILDKITVDGKNYLFDNATGDDLTGTMDDNKEITCWYTLEDEPITEYTLTIHYKHIVNGDTLHEDFTVTLYEDAEYDYTAQKFDELTVDGHKYSFDNMSGDNLTGIMNSNKEITLWYFLDEEETPEEYTITMRFKNETGTVIKEEYVSGLIAAGSPWEYDAAPATIEYNGVTYDFDHYDLPDFIKGDNLMQNLIVTAYYVIHIDPPVDPNPIELTLRGQKLLDDQPAAGYQFTAEMNGEVYTATSGDDGVFSFSLPFSEASDYEIEITEVAGNNDKIIYDDSTYLATITIGHDLESNTLYLQNKALSHEINGELSDAQEIIFRNTTKQTPPTPVDPEPEDPTSVTVTPRVIKLLDGKDDFTYENGFLFRITNVSDSAFSNAGIANTSIVRFEPMPYYSAEGTYIYRITEVAGNDSSINYDSTEYLMTIMVTLDKENNALVADVTYTNAATGEAVETPIFRNTTKQTPPPVDPDPEPKDPTPAKVSISGEKYLNTLVPTTQFDFVLKDASGNAVETVKNDGKNITFSDLTFDDTGIYNYTVSEVTGDDGMVAYDDTIYNVTITVTLDKESNTLIASTAITANGESAQIIFNNSTKNAPIDPPKPQPEPKPEPKPEPQPKPDPKPEPKPDPIPTPDPVTPAPEPVTEPKDTDKDLDDVPQTGEPISMAAVMTAMIGAGAGLGIINRKKKDNDQ